ncbi:hypothetical protein ACWD3F_04025, partial [Streptomyces sp. NPDC002767]
MRRTVRVLSATALACTALGAAASAASADPGAQAVPRSLRPGERVTVSVSCDATAGAPPEFVDARTNGFEGREVRLHRVSGGADTKAVIYRGTVRVPSGASTRGGSGGGTGAASHTAGSGASRGVGEPAVVRAVEGMCPVGPGGRARPWKASYSVGHDAPDTALGTSREVRPKTPVASSEVPGKAPVATPKGPGKAPVASPEVPREVPAVPRESPRDVPGTSGSAAVGGGVPKGVSAGAARDSAPVVRGDAAGEGASAVPSQAPGEV